VPWKEIRPMDQRAEFVLEAERSDLSFRELCARYGVSTKTGYKWLDRFREGGIAALHERSRRPHASAGLGEDIVCRMIALKAAHPHWGPRKIRVLYARKHGESGLPSESSFKRVLEKAGFVEKRPARRPAADGGRIQARREPTAPNDVWTVDLKGWWQASDHRRCEPLTIRDGFSRYLICVDPLGSSKTAVVRARFEEAFGTYGLPATIRTDNGPPFASPNGLLGLSALSVWWLALGISLDRIDPGRPDQNGGHERMHRDIRLEVQGMARGDFASQRAALSVWRESYNSERPHEALGMKTPGAVYTASARAFSGTPERFAYGEGFAERRVQHSGMIRLGGTPIFLSTALRGWNVGLREERAGLIGVWFGGLRLGRIDRRTDSFAAGAVEMPP